jgi:hypothetical protein
MDKGENIYTAAPKMVTINNHEGLYSNLAMQRTICQKVVRFLVILFVTVFFTTSLDMSVIRSIIFSTPSAKMKNQMFVYC